MGGSKIIFVNSYDRINKYPQGTPPITASSNSTLFRIYFSNPLINVKRMTLTKAMIPATYYNVYDYTFNGIQSQNNLLVVDTGATTVVTMPVGAYNITNFDTMLQATLNAQVPAGVWTVNTDQITYKTTITCTIPFRFLSSYLSTNDSNFMYELGFINDPVINGQVLALTQTSNNAVRLDLPETAFIRITNMQTNVSTTSGVSCAFTVPLDTTTSNIVFFQNTYKELNSIEFLPDLSLSIQNFTIELTDNFGRLIDLNGADWWFEIRVDLYTNEELQRERH